MKKIIALALALVMVLGLAACSVEKTEAPAPTAAPAATEAPKAEAPAATEAAAAPVEISLWTFPVGKWGEEATVNGWIEAFQAEYPHITVKVEYLDYQAGDDKLNTAIEGGQAPDLIFEGPERLIAQYAARGLLLDLTDLKETAGGKGLYPSIVNTCSIDGKMYAFPISQMAHCMVLNRDIFEAADALKYLNEETGTWNSVDDYFNAIQAVYDSGHKDVMTIYCGGQGGDQGTRHMISCPAGNTPWSNPEHTQYTFATQANADILARFYAQDGVSFDPAIVAGDEINLFVQGVLAMGNCWNATLYNNNKDAINFNVLPMAFPTDEAAPALAGGFYCLGVFDNKDAARAEAAKTFIEWMTSDDAIYTEAVLAAGQWPTRDLGVDLYAGDEVMSQYGKFAPWFGDYYQITKGWAEFRTEMWNALQRIAKTDGSSAAILAELEAAQTAANAAASAQ